MSVKLKRAAISFPLMLEVVRGTVYGATEPCQSYLEP